MGIDGRERQHLFTFTTPRKTLAVMIQGAKGKGRSYLE